MLFSSSLALRPLVIAAPPPIITPPTLAISQIKITGDEFIVLQNNSGQNISDLSGYWLNYFNNSDPQASGVSSSSQQLPGVDLGNGQTILLSSDGMPTCGAVAAAKLTISLGDSRGFLQISQTSVGSLGVSILPIDSVSWSSGTDGAITGVNSKDSQSMYYRSLGSGTNGWQLADSDAAVPCQIDAIGGGSVNSSLVLGGGAVPSIVKSSAAGTDLPSDDVGLSVPRLSEILPNPASPQTDADDEFIELYNSNSQPFDLSGFSLQVGTTTTHKYTFPAGTDIQPQQFSAYYSSDTGLSLSNSGGQVKLLDPSGNQLAQSDIYSTAKDGYAWIYANGTWQWTTSPTPSAKNIVNSPVSKNIGTKSSGKTAVLGAHTSGPSGSSYSGSASTTPSSLHPLILAGIGTLAVLYALYEYRNDLANTLYRFRRYRAARRGTRQST